MQRTVKTTVLLVGEGNTEYAFLSYLKGLYIDRGSLKSVKIENAHGGSPDCIIHRTIKLNPADYDFSYVVLDPDRPFEEEGTELKVRKKKLQLIMPKPCIEALFLRILNQANIPPSTPECKRLFRNFLLDDEKTDKTKYQKIFSKEMVEERSNTLDELKQILNIFK
ncbi:MAG: RloB domain-containing protein [Candidatus Goldbacteria bacterium]|nr:RloB domain-containing protein [Candidatus Goldiibacteriota bacterium]